MPRTKKSQPENGNIATAAAINGIPKAFDLPVVNTSLAVRTTLVLPAETDLNLDLCRLKLGITRTELIKRALHKFLLEEGFDPQRPPKNLGVSY